MEEATKCFDCGAPADEGDTCPFCKRSFCPDCVDRAEDCCSKTEDDRGKYAPLHPDLLRKW